MTWAADCLILSGKNLVSAEPTCNGGINITMEGHIGEDIVEEDIAHDGSDKTREIEGGIRFRMSELEERKKRQTLVQYSLDRQAGQQETCAVLEQQAFAPGTH